MNFKLYFSSLIFTILFLFNSFSNVELKFMLPSIDTLHDNEDTSSDQINIRTYLDFHYAFDPNLPSDRMRLYGSNPYHVNQFDIGYAFAELSYKTKNFRTSLALNTGSLVERMYILENEQIKRIRELSGEYFLGNGLSVEGGIMPAMYGFEGFINKENWFSTRAVMTDFAPDFDLGVRLNYRKGKNWIYRFQIANGWQTIRETNKNKAIGTLIKYENSNLLVNWGTMLTNESTIDSINLERFYSNFFMKFKIGKKWQIAPLWDYGIQRDSFNFKKIHFWTSACLNVRYHYNSKMNFAARYEYFYDPKQIVPDVVTNTPNGFRYKGASICFEYAFHKFASFRIETRYAHSLDKIYTRKNIKNDSNNNIIIMGQFLFELHHHLKIQASY